jgi:hypothetical protein
MLVQSGHCHHYHLLDIACSRHDMAETLLIHPISIYIVYISVLLVVFHMMNEG